MGFDKREDDYNISESGNWNVAADYSKLKIMKPLYLCDVYENIAKFGYDNILEDLINYAIPDDIVRLKGFTRLIHELLRLIENTRFAMKVKGTLDKMKEYEDELKKVIKILPLLSKTITTRKGKIVKIQEENYNKILNVVLNLKSKINTPLNQNHLIFTDKEEFDPQAYKEAIIKNVTTRG